jgi:hypothetical protein
MSQPLRFPGNAPQPDPRPIIRELVREAIIEHPEMATPALRVYLMSTAPGETIAAFAFGLAAESIDRLIRAARIKAATPPPDEHGQTFQPYLPRFAEQLKELPDIIPNRLGEPIPKLKATYPDLLGILQTATREYWERRSSDPKIAATRGLLNTMQPYWEENPDVELEQALALETEKTMPPDPSGSH